MWCDLHDVSPCVVQMTEVVDARSIDHRQGPGTDQLGDGDFQYGLSGGVGGGVDHTMPGVKGEVRARRGSPDSHRRGVGHPEVLEIRHIGDVAPLHLEIRLKRSRVVHMEMVVRVHLSIAEPHGEAAMPVGADGDRLARGGVGAERLLPQAVGDCIGDVRNARRQPSRRGRYSSASSRPHRGMGCRVTFGGGRYWMR